MGSKPVARSLDLQETNEHVALERRINIVFIIIALRPIYRLLSVKLFQW